MLGVPLWHSIGECRRGRMVSVHLFRWWIVCAFMLLLCFLGAILFASFVVLLSNLPPPNLSSVSTSCKILSTGILSAHNWSLIQVNNTLIAKNISSISCSWCAWAYRLCLIIVLSRRMSCCHRTSSCTLLPPVMQSFSLRVSLRPPAHEFQLCVIFWQMAGFLRPEHCCASPPSLFCVHIGFSVPTCAQIHNGVNSKSWRSSSPRAQKFWPDFGVVYPLNWQIGNQTKATLSPE